MAGPIRQESHDGVGNHPGVIGDAGHYMAQELIQSGLGKLGIGIELEGPGTHAIGQEGQLVTELDGKVGDYLCPGQVPQRSAE